MKKITLGIIAHVDSGKTTLSEALLYLSGVLRNFGRVDKGASFLDNDSLERRRGITIFSKQARFQYGDTSFVLIDTPGHADFTAETERALKILDYCILLISAQDGIKGQTKTLWNLLKEYQVPAFIFVNKMDQDGSDKTTLKNALKELTDDAAVDFLQADPEEFAMYSERAMEEYLETGTVSEELIKEMIAERRMFPCFYGSALTMEGVKELMDALNEYTLPPLYADDFSARVYKIGRSDDNTRLTFVKITGGSVKNRDILPDGDGESKITQIRFYSGEKFTTSETAQAGDVCALAGLKESYAGQGFGELEEDASALLTPVLRYRVLLSDGTDPLKALPVFRVLEEESPELSISWEEEKKEIYVNVMGKIQLEILKTILKERFSLEADFDSGEVVYRETIAAPVIGVGHFEPLRHYAEVHLLMEPLPAGNGLIFDTAVSTDRLSKNWQRLILTHLAERRHRGVLTGSPITDMKITLTAGKAHLKHTEGGDFRQAVYRAVRQGLMMAENILLEPFYQFTLEIPAENIGRALHDLDRFHADFSPPQNGDSENTSVITGRGPVALLKDYPADVSAYTKGRGMIRFSPDGFGICRDAEAVIAAKGYDPERDLRNTADSVFCRNGAGVIVPYYEVYEYMHLDFDGSDHTADAPDMPSSGRRVSGKPLGTEEIERIIAGISGSNTGKKGPGSRWKKKFGTAGASGKAAKKAAVGKTFGSADPSSRQEGSPAGKTSRNAGASTAVFATEDADYVLADGYNIIFAWEELSALAKDDISAARDALVSELSRFASMTHAKVIAVFDAYRIKGHARENTVFQDVQLIYTKEEETADQYIERFANRYAPRNKVLVITSDGTEQVVAQGQGCRLISSREFKTYLDSMTQQFNEKYKIK